MNRSKANTFDQSVFCTVLCRETSLFLWTPFFSSHWRQVWPVQIYLSCFWADRRWVSVESHLADVFISSKGTCVLDISEWLVGSDERHFNVSQLWETRSEDSVNRPQLLKRTESRSGCLYGLRYGPYMGCPHRTHIENVNGLSIGPM